MGWSWSDTLELIGIGAQTYSGFQNAEAMEEYFDALAEDQERVAEANAELSYEDARTALKQASLIRRNTERNFGLRMKQMERLLSSQKKVFANSGVVSNTGTALDIQRKTASDMTEDMNIEYWNGRRAEDRAEDLARRYVILGDNGLRDAAAQASLIQNQAHIAQQNQYWQTAGNIFTYLAKD